MTGEAGPRTSWALMAAAMLGLTACGRAAPVASGGGAADAAGYLPPPTLATATRRPDGGVTLSGAAPGDAKVRLRDPEGGAFSAAASDGAWSITLPPAARPRMFAFEGQVAARALHAEGAVLILPSPGPAATLTRAGYGALSIGALSIKEGANREGRGPLRLTAIDYDGGGGGAVSGVTAPHATVRLMLDGHPVGDDQADDQGRFSVLDLSARRLFTPGEHLIRVESHGAAVQGPLDVSPMAALGAAPFHVQRQPGAWRADWRIPGGGTQTTVVFDAPAPDTAAPPLPTPADRPPSAPVSEKP